MTDRERETLALLRASDPAGFDRVYAKYRHRVYSFLVRLSGRRDLADDLFQETWLRLADKGRELRPDSDVEAWLFTVARHAFLSAMRAQSTSGERSGGDRDAIALDRVAAPDAGLHLSAIERALLELPLADRELLLLLAGEQLRQDQLAAILGLEPATLRQRVTRARARLVRQLDAQSEPNDVPTPKEKCSS